MMSSVVKKRSQRSGQISVEYLIISGFVMLLVLGILAVALVYSAQTRDRVRANQVSTFADSVIQQAESVFYAGEPSQVTLKLYLPESVQNVTIQTNQVVFTTRTSSGINIASFTSDVPLQGTISAQSGVQRLVLRATTTSVTISPS